MARPSDPRIDAALARVSPGVVWEGAGVWRLALTNGSVATVRARVGTDWLELTCPLPAEAEVPGDRWSLLVNAELHGAARIVRRFDAEVPHLRADVRLEPAGDLGDAVVSACMDLAYARQVLHTGPDGVPAAWTARDALGDVVTRAGMYRPRLEEGDGRARVVVELGELRGYSSHAMRAVSALLVTAGASVPGVITAFHERDRVPVAVCAAPVRAPLDCHVDHALAGVSAVCEASGRELQALRHEVVAAAYLRHAAWAQASRRRADGAETTSVSQASQLLLEEQSCTQQ